MAGRGNGTSIELEAKRDCIRFWWVTNQTHLYAKVQVLSTKQSPDSNIYPLATNITFAIWIQVLVSYTTTLCTSRNFLDQLRTINNQCTLCKNTRSKRIMYWDYIQDMQIHGDPWCKTCTLGGLGWIGIPCRYLQHSENLIGF